MCELLESGERGVGRKIRGDELRAVGNDGGDGAGGEGVGLGLGVVVKLTTNTIFRLILLYHSVANVNCI